MRPYFDLRKVTKSGNSIAMTNDLFHIRLREARLLCGLSMDKVAGKKGRAFR